MDQSRRALIRAFALWLCASAPCLFARAARAVPLALEMSSGAGLGYARLAGVYRDDASLKVRVALGIGQRTAVAFGLASDLERIEASLHLGVQVRPWRGGSYSPYVRLEAGLMGASSIGSTYELLGGAGLWLRLFGWSSRWTALSGGLALFVEVDAFGHLGEAGLLGEQLQIGLALTTPRFWR